MELHPKTLQLTSGNNPMSLSIEYARNNQIDRNRIEAFLLKTDKDFSPPLSTRVSIVDYVQKVMTNGVLLLALVNNEVVGINGFYCNDMEQYIGYWTVMVVARENRKTGIPQKFVNEMISYSQRSGMKKIRMETSTSNDAVLNLVLRNGFVKFAEHEMREGGYVPVYFEKDIEV